MIDREKVRAKYGGRCAYCGDLLGDRFQIDHIDPKYIGGKDDLENLNPSCARCNNWKQTFSIEQFRNEIQRQTERLAKYQSGYRLAKDFGLILETGVPIKFWFEILQEKWEMKK